MIECLLGALGCVIALGVFGLGWGVGRWSRPRPRACGGCAAARVLSENSSASASGQRGPIPCPPGGCPPTAAVSADELSATRQEEDEDARRAFEALMNYNAETAYGLNRGMGGGEP